MESESEAASTSSTSSSKQAASPSHVEHVPREIEASAITSFAQNPSASPSVQVSSITPKADIPEEQVAEEEEEEEEEESTTISEESSASLASLASTEHQLATLKSSLISLRSFRLPIPLGTPILLHSCSTVSTHLTTLRQTPSFNFCSRQTP